MSDIVERLRSYSLSPTVQAEAADKIERLHGLLTAMVDLAEYWFNREDRRGMGEQRYRDWHSLGYGSTAYRNARAALAESQTGSNDE